MKLKLIVIISLFLLFMTGCKSDLSDEIIANTEDIAMTISESAKVPVEAAENADSVTLKILDSNIASIVEGVEFEDNQFTVEGKSIGETSYYIEYYKGNRMIGKTEDSIIIVKDISDEQKQAETEGENRELKKERDKIMEDSFCIIDTESYYENGEYSYTIMNKGFDRYSFDMKFDLYSKGQKIESYEFNYSSPQGSNNSYSVDIDTPVDKMIITEVKFKSKVNSSDIIFTAEDDLKLFYYSNYKNYVNLVIDNLLSE